MVICPCNMMLHQTNKARSSRLPLPKTLQKSDFSDKSVIRGQPIASNDYNISEKMFHPENDHNSSSQTSNAKINSLVLGNFNGKYVKTQPLKPLMQSKNTSLPQVHHFPFEERRRNSKNFYSSSGQRLQIRKPEGLDGVTKPFPVDNNKVSRPISVRYQTSLSNNTLKEYATLPCKNYTSEVNRNEESAISNAENTQNPFIFKERKNLYAASTLPNRGSQKQKQKRMSFTENVSKNLNNKQNLTYKKPTPNFTSRTNFHNLTQEGTNTFVPSFQYYSPKPIIAKTGKLKENKNHVSPIIQSSSKIELSSGKAYQNNKNGRENIWRFKNGNGIKETGRISREGHDRQCANKTPKHSKTEALDSDADSDLETSEFLVYETLASAEDEFTRNLASIESSKLEKNSVLVSENGLKEMEKDKNQEDILSLSSNDSFKCDNFLSESFQQLQKQIADLRESSKKVTFNFVKNRNQDEELQDDKLLSVKNNNGIDCDIQAMPKLNQLQLFMARQKSGITFDDFPSYSSQRKTKFCEDKNSPRLSFLDSLKELEEAMPSFNFRETYWDYWLAKNKLKDLRNDSIISGRNQSPSRDRHDSCYASEKLYYDPEILLAQAAHPHSLRNATFSEYSSHIKATIMERYALQNNEEYENLKDKPSQLYHINDPGYLSDSDAFKLKKFSTQNFYEEIPRSDTFPFDHFMYNASPKKLNPNKYPLFNPSQKVTFPTYLDDQLNLYENPWSHLLPNIVPVSPVHFETDSSSSPYNSSAEEFSKISSNYSPVSTKNKQRLEKTEIVKADMPPKRNLSKCNSSKNGKKRSFLPVLFRKKDINGGADTKRKSTSPSNAKLKPIASNVKSKNLDISLKAGHKKLQTNEIQSHSEPNTPKSRLRRVSFKGLDCETQNFTSQQSTSSSSSSTRSSQDTVKTAIFKPKLKLKSVQDW